MTNTFKTKSGKPLNPIGIGTWKMGGEREALVDKELDRQHVQAMKYSMSLGQNHIDTAELYGNGHTDELVGEAIKDANRQDLFIANKIWQNSVGKKATATGVSKMLDRLGTDYIDLLYIHYTFDSPSWLDALEPIANLIDSKVVRNFGVSNFSLDDMGKVSSRSDLKISANQVQYNVLTRNNANEKFLQYCNEKEINVVAYQPIGRGKVSSNEAIIEIASRYGATPAQIALAWLLNQKVLTIPKSSNKAHIDENMASLAIELSEKDIEILQDIVPNS